MPDIVMCDALSCKKSKQCYRHRDSGTRPKEYRQSYWLRGEQSPVGDDCNNFWQVSALVKAEYDETLP